MNVFFAGSIDLVVADTTASVSVVQKAEELGIPVVASEWVVQCLITGTRVSYDGHISYKHDFRPKVSKK